MRNPIKAFVGMLRSVTGLERWTSARNIDLLAGSMGASSVFDSVWAIGGVETNAQAMSSLKILFKDSAGKIIERPSIEQRQWMSVFANPDPMLCGRQLWEFSSMAYDIEGEVIWVLMDAMGSPIRNPLDVPERIMPYGPSRVKPTFRNGTNVVTGWTLSNEGGFQQQLELFQVVRFWKTNPATLRRGLSLMDKIGSTISLDRGAKQVNRGFFARGARLGGVLQMTGTRLEDEKAKDWARSFSASYGSSENSHKIPLLPKDMTFTPSDGSKDMDFEKLYGVNRDEFFGGTRTPKHMMGVNDDINYATAEVLDRSFWLNVIKPKTSVFADVVNTKMLLGSGMVMEFDYSKIPVLQIDAVKSQDTKAKLATRLYNLGWAVNDINRSLEMGMPEITDKWANTSHDPQLATGGKQITVDAPNEKAIDTPWQRMQKSLVSANFAGTEKTKAEPKTEAEILAAALDGDESAGEQYAQIVEDATFGPLVAPMTKVVESYFNRLRKSQETRLTAFLSGGDYRGKVNADDPGERELTEENIESVLFNEGKWNSILVLDTAPYHLRAYIAGLDRVTEELGGKLQTFQRVDSAAVAAAEKIGSKITAINDRLRENIKNALLNDIRSGASHADMVESVANQFDSALSRSVTIARTESASAASAARWDVLSVEVEEKQWVSAQDGNVRSSHRKYARMGSKPMDYEYAEGLKHPLDWNCTEAGEVVNCRCTLVVGKK